MSGDAIDPLDLGRFSRAQDAGRAHDRALTEIRQGRKQTHWIWFVFPQIRGLGRSSTAQTYAISGRGEAEAYLAHAVLAGRVREAAGAMLRQGREPEAVLGDLDARKLRSSMTLFDAVKPDDVFAGVLDRHFAGQRDPATLDLLEWD